MAHEKTYEDGLLEGELNAQIRRIDSLEDFVRTYPTTMTNSLQTMEVKLTQAIHTEVLPIRKAVLGNGNERKSIVSQVIANATSIKWIVRIGCPLFLAVVGAGLGVYFAT